MAVLAVVPFAGSLGSGFVYDDHLLIEERGAVHSLARLPELLFSDFWRGSSGIHMHYLRPLVSLSYALDWTAFDGNPTWFHAVNLTLHAAAAALAYAAIARWSGRPTLAALGALAWAWHPSKTEAVAWISGRTDLLCTVALLALGAVASARMARAPRRSIAPFLLAEAALFVVALGSKELGVVAPVIVAVEAWVVAGRPALGRATALRALGAGAPYALASLAYVALRQRYFPIVPAGAGHLPWRDAALYAIETQGELARILTWPSPLSLLRAPIQTDAAGTLLHAPLRIVAGGAFVAAGVAAFAATHARRPAVAVALAFFAGTVLPNANVIPSKMAHLASERFLYLPSVGLAAALVAALPHAAVALRWAAGAALGVAGAGAALAARRAADFADDATLWAHELRVDPAQPVALRWLCTAALVERRFSDAIALAVRGSRAIATAYVGQPYRVEFALRAATARGELTLDADRARLAELDAFFRAFLDRRGVARLALEQGDLSFDAAGPEARRYRQNEPTLTAEAHVWGAIAAARAGDAPRAARLVREVAGQLDDVGTRAAGATVLARAGAWDEAFALAASIDHRFPVAASLARDLAAARASTDAAARATGVDRAVSLARAATLVRDRGGAFRAVDAERAAFAADAEGAAFYARIAWAAGFDADARAALAPFATPAALEARLAAWAVELGRAPAP